MARELTFGGFRMSAREWRELDENARLQYLRAFIETSPPRAEGWVYESYELTIENRA